MTVEKMDRDDHKRFMERVKAARQRPHITQTMANPIKQVGNGVPHRTHYSRGFVLPQRVLGYSSPAALGDAVRKAIINREIALSHRGDGLMIHVKDGKPLTEKGAKMLGVAWPT
jgi:hypothetical protein